jgi:predicted site-specific integrase-resolvase
VYARVSSRKQLPHRLGQEAEARRAAVERFDVPEASVRSFVDVGSGLAFKSRRGFQALLELVLRRRVRAVVVTYKDRLARFGVDHFEWLFRKFGTELVVLNQATTDPAERVAEDLLAIVTVFAARAHGMRRYKRSLEKEFGGDASKDGRGDGEGEEEEGQGAPEGSPRPKAKRRRRSKGEGRKEKAEKC